MVQIFIYNNLLPGCRLQTGQDIGTTRVQNRARAACQGNGPQGLAGRRIVPIAGRPRQSRVAVPHRRHWVNICFRTIYFFRICRKEKRINRS